MRDSNIPIQKIAQYMSVSKNRDTPKWMVKIMENPLKIDGFSSVNISRPPASQYHSRPDRL